MYKAKVWSGYNYEKRCSELVETRTIGTLKSARMFAEDYLRPHAVHDTVHCYKRELDRRPTVAIYEIMKDPVRLVRIETVLPDVRIVPSVGELGWSP